jgi:glycerol-3-phosphate dehydrogenase (NAD(P)+)
MDTVSVIGGGAFGTAMACVVRRSGREVLLWAREPEVVASINADHANPHFLPGVALDPGIRATADLAEAAGAATIVLMAAPAQHVRSVAGAMRASLRNGAIVVSCSKGIERGSAALMPEVLVDMLPDARIAILSGPSFAKEIATDLPCGVVLACRDWVAGEEATRAIANPHFCVHMSDDPIGTALGGVMKNVVAIASGIAHGRKLGENARATIVTLGLEESVRLGIAKGAKAETFLGLAGAGDFMLTANSLQSRNTSLGVALGEGQRLADILAGRKQVTEGAFSAEGAAALGRRLHVEMPITEALDGLLNHGVALEAAMSRFLHHLPPLYRAGEPRTAVIA